MKRAAAQKIADDLTDKKIEASINGLLVELEHQSGSTDQVVATYADRISKITSAHAAATDFITRTFEE